MTGLLGLRNKVTAQEKHNVELANSNTTLRKQVVELIHTNANTKEMISYLEKELVVS